MKFFLRFFVVFVLGLAMAFLGTGIVQGAMDIAVWSHHARVLTVLIAFLFAAVSLFLG